MVAEYFGEAPANPKACKYLDAGYGSYKLADFCTAYGVNDPSFYNSHRVLEDPAAGLRHGRRRPVHRLLRLDPEVDGDQGLSPIPSRRGVAAPPVAPIARRRHDAGRPSRAAEQPAAAPVRVRLPPPVAPGAAAPDAADGLVRPRLPRLAGRAVRVGLLVPGPADVRGHPRVHAQELPAAAHRPRLPDDHVPDHRDGGAGHRHRRDPRLPHRVLHGPHRRPAHARRDVHARAAAAVVELPRPGVRVARDPRPRRPARMGVRADRDPGRRSCIRATSPSRSCSATSGCRS